MKSIKSTTAYWKKFLHEVLAMVKQLSYNERYDVLSKNPAALTARHFQFRVKVFLKQLSLMVLQERQTIMQLR